MHALIVVSLVFFVAYPEASIAGEILELVRSGTTCVGARNGLLNCRYRVGRDLEFSIEEVGSNFAGISFSRSDDRGDYYARFGVAHGCVFISAGHTAPDRVKYDPREHAFVSPKNGRSYETWEDCKAAR